MINEFNQQILKLERENKALAEERDRLRDILEHPAQIWHNWLYDKDVLKNHTGRMFSQWLTDNYDVGAIGIVFKQAAAALANDNGADAGAEGVCRHAHSTLIGIDSLSGEQTWKRRCDDCGHVWEDN